MQIRPYKALFFDLDGTLIDMNKLVMPLFYMIIVFRFRKVFSPRQSIKHFKGSLKSLENKVTNELNSESIINYYMTATSATKDEVIQILHNILHKDFQKLNRFFYEQKNASKIIAAAKEAGYRLILATDPVFEPVIVKNRMAWGNINFDDFEYVSHNNNSTRKKPSREYYKNLCQKLNLLESECLHIGNDFKMDYPAKAAGLDLFMLDHSVNKGLEHQNFMSGSMNDLAKLLNLSLK